MRRAKEWRLYCRLFSRKQGREDYKVPPPYFTNPDARQCNKRPLPAEDSRHPLQNFLHEGFLLENRERPGLLAGAEEARRDAELVVNGHGDAAFSRAVELGDD